MPTEPDGWYGLTKLMAEQMGLLYLRRSALDFRAVRLAAVTGPGRSAGSGSASLFTSLIPEKAALGEPYEIEVDEDAAYPVVYIKDAANALFTLATVDTAPRRIYNISSGRVVASELVSMVKSRISDARFSFKPDPMIMAVVRGFVDWRINCQRAEEDLGWTPGFTVKRMVKDIIESARNR
jgi:nucleoside-diphosphate-sugar epimerase